MKIGREGGEGGRERGRDEDRKGGRRRRKGEPGVLNVEGD